MLIRPSDSAKLFGDTLKQFLNGKSIDQLVNGYQKT